MDENRETVKIALSDEELSMIFGGAGVVKNVRIRGEKTALTFGKSDMIDTLPDCSDGTAPDPETEGGKNVPGGNEDIWRRK